MWRPATRQITGTNEGEHGCLPKFYAFLTPPVLVPLGQRRRFGPAPTEESAPPQLAQPSPSAYPRQQGQESVKRGRDDTPNEDPKSKLSDTPLTRLSLAFSLSCLDLLIWR